MNSRVALCALAALLAAQAHALPLSDHPELRDFIHDMHRAHGFSARALEQLFQSARLRPEILQATERPEEAFPWYEYRRQFVNDARVEQGVAFWRRHAQLLQRAQREYGVPPEVVVAILGVETQYGRSAGRWPVLDALVTLMLRYPPRAAFFRQELEHYLLLAREQRLNPLTVKGSYAGAIGMPQFIPSSWRRYAVDFDGDGKRDLLGSTADIVGSVANFLRVHGWQAHAPVADAARVEGTLHFWLAKLGTRPALPLRQFARHGVSPATRRDPDLLAALILLEGETGPETRIGYNNFYVLTRYNRSHRYAMAVHELAEQIRRQHQETR